MMEMSLHGWCCILLWEYLLIIRGAVAGKGAEVELGGELFSGTFLWWMGEVG